MRTYALAAVLVLTAAGAWAALPPNSYLDIDAKLEEDHRLYQQPLNMEEAAKVAGDEVRPPVVRLVWQRVDPSFKLFTAQELWKQTGLVGSKPLP